MDWCHSSSWFWGLCGLRALLCVPGGHFHGPWPQGAVRAILTEIVGGRGLPSSLQETSSCPTLSITVARACSPPLPALGTQDLVLPQSRIKSQVLGVDPPSVFSFMNRRGISTNPYLGSHSNGYAHPSGTALHYDDVPCINGSVSALLGRAS